MDSVMKGREIVMKIGNVKALWSAPWFLTVMGLALAAAMSVANNPRVMLARTARQTMTAQVILCAALIMFAEIPVLGLATAATCLVIVRRVREIVMMTWDVMAPLSVELTIVLGPDSAAVMTVANNLWQMRARTA